jgi:hypothetical protein
VLALTREPFGIPPQRDPARLAAVLCKFLKYAIFRGIAALT